MLLHQVMRVQHPSVRLNFFGASLDGRVAFTRAQTANYFDNAGLLQSAASGIARFEFDPTTLTPNGMLMEDARTNICLRSAAPASATWVKTTATTNSANQTGPDGTTSYGTVTASAGNGLILQTVTVVDATVYQFSLRLKRLVGTGSIQMTMDNGVTWTTVSVTSTLTRFTISGTSVGTTMIVGMRIVTNNDSVVFGGAQLEVGAYPTSELGTTGTSTARNLDQASILIPGPIYSDGYFAAMLEFQLVGLAGTTRLMRIIGPNAQNAKLINLDTSGNITVTDTTSNASTTSGTVATVGLASVHRVGISYGPHGLMAAVDGVVGTATPLTSPPKPVVLMQSLDLGPASSTGSYYQRRLTFWRTAVSPDRLALATAL